MNEINFTHYDMAINCATFHGQSFEHLISSLLILFSFSWYHGHGRVQYSPL